MKLAFLLYVSRSGSTFFARHLQEQSRRLVVPPENRLVEVLIAEGGAALAGCTVPELQRVFSWDPQSANLGLSAADWNRIGAAADNERPIESLLAAVARCWAEPRGLDPQVALYKNGNALHIARQVIEEIPDARFVHVFRDGRAASSSMLRADDPYHPGESLGQGSILHAALHWRRYMREAAALVDEHPERLHEVAYERLVLDPPAVAAEAVAFLGLSPRGRETPADVVSPREEALHPKVQQAAEPQRVDAWRRELSDGRRRVFEVVAGRELAARSYPLLGAGGTRTGVALAGACAGHLVGKLRFWLRRVGGFLADPARARNKIRLRLLRRAGRAPRLRS